MEPASIRPIQKGDDDAVCALIRKVMPEFGAVGPGYAIVDPEVEAMHQAYSMPRTRYLIACLGDRLVGGGGIAALQGGGQDVCELKKMYFLSEARGHGLGERMLKLLLDEARRMQYRYCYLETLKSMTSARRLYEKLGFQALKGPEGKTGHFGCDHWYQLEL